MLVGNVGKEKKNRLGSAQTRAPKVTQRGCYFILWLMKNMEGATQLCWNTLTQTPKPHSPRGSFRECINNTNTWVTPQTQRSGNF